MKTITIDGKEVELKSDLLVGNIKTITDPIELKKLECRKGILSKYSDSDQNNILMSGIQEDIDTMKSFIKAMVDEFKENGKDANFSNIK